MSTDLQDLFADSGRSAPESRVDTDEVVRQGRRLRARRRAAGGGALLGAGAAVAASVLLVSGLGASGTGVRDGLAVAPAAGGSSGAPSAPASSPTAVDTTATATVPGSLPTGGSGTGRKPQPPEAIAARLELVTLPDPAPGFPLRRWPDSVAGESFTAGDNEPTWTKLFGLAVTAPTTTTGADGTVSEPTGPEVTLRVGLFAPAAEKDGRINGDRVVATVPVAGTEGRVTTSLDKGTPVRTLYLHVNDLSVEIIGFDGVSTPQLVALGNALTGLT